MRLEKRHEGGVCAEQREGKGEREACMCAEERECVCLPPHHKEVCKGKEVQVCRRVVQRGWCACPSSPAGAERRWCGMQIEISCSQPAQAEVRKSKEAERRGGQVCVRKEKRKSR